MTQKQLKQKTKNKLYVFKIYDEDGNILKVMTGVDYSQLWYMGTVESKATRGYWEIFDLDGRAIDGNLKLIKEGK